MSNKDLIIDERKLELFLRSNSFIVNLSLYFLHLAYKAQKGFTITNLNKKNPSVNKDSFNTTMVISYSLGLIEFTHNESEDIFTITEYNEKLATLIKSVVYEKADKYDKKNMSELDKDYSWVEMAKELEKYF